MPARLPLRLWPGHGGLPMIRAPWLLPPRLPARLSLSHLVARRSPRCASATPGRSSTSSPWRSWATRRRGPLSSLLSFRSFLAPRRSRAFASSPPNRPACRHVPSPLRSGSSRGKTLAPRSSRRAWSRSVRSMTPRPSSSPVRRKAARAPTLASRSTTGAMSASAPG